MYYDVEFIKFTWQFANSLLTIEGKLTVVVLLFSYNVSVWMDKFYDYSCYSIQ